MIRTTGLEFHAREADAFFGQLRRIEGALSSVEGATFGVVGAFQAWIGGRAFGALKNVFGRIIEGGLESTRTMIQLKQSFGGAMADTVFRFSRGVSAALGMTTTAVRDAMSQLHMLGLDTMAVVGELSDGTKASLTTMVADVAAFSGRAFGDVVYAVQAAKRGYSQALYWMLGPQIGPEFTKWIQAGNIQKAYELLEKYNIAGFSVEMAKTFSGSVDRIRAVFSSFVKDLAGDEKEVGTLMYEIGRGFAKVAERVRAWYYDLETMGRRETVKKLMEGIKEGLLPFIEFAMAALERFTDFIARALDWLGEHPGVTKFLVKLAMFAGVVMTVVPVIVGALTIVVTVFSKLGGIIGGIVSGALSVGSGLVVIGAAVALWWQDIKLFAEGFMWQMRYTLPMIKAAFWSLAAAGKQLWGALVRVWEAFQGTTDEVGRFSQGMEAANSFTRWVVEAAENLVQWLEKVSDWVDAHRSEIVGFLQGLKAGIETLVRVIGHVIHAAWLIIKGLFDQWIGHTKVFVGFFTGNLDLMREGFQQWADGLATMFKGLFEGVFSMLLSNYATLLNNMSDMLFESTFWKGAKLAEQYGSPTGLVWTPLADFEEKAKGKISEYSAGVEERQAQLDRKRDYDLANKTMKEQQRLAEDISRAVGAPGGANEYEVLRDVQDMFEEYKAESGDNEMTMIEFAKMLNQGEEKTYDLTGELVKGGKERNEKLDRLIALQEEARFAELFSAMRVMGEVAGRMFIPTMGGASAGGAPTTINDHSTTHVYGADAAELERRRRTEKMRKAAGNGEKLAPSDTVLSLEAMS